MKNLFNNFILKCIVTSLIETSKTSWIDCEKIKNGETDYI